MDSKVPGKDAEVQGLAGFKARWKVGVSRRGKSGIKSDVTQNVPILDPDFQLEIAVAYLCSSFRDVAL